MIRGRIDFSIATPYRFEPGKVYNLKADAFINDHNDICKHQVAYALLKSVARI